MNYFCPNCRVILAGTNRCMLCGRISNITRPGSATIEEVHDGPARQKATKRKADHEHAPELSHSLEPVQAPRLSPATSYALIHTMGENDPSIVGGDSAYANWLQRYFENHLEPAGCVAVRQLIYRREKFETTERLAAQLQVVALREIDAFLGVPEVSGTRTLVLNWHIRLSGHPNTGQTGRGTTPALIARLTEYVRRRGFRLVVLYTVHEVKGMGKPENWRGAGSHLLTLNPDVRQGLAHTLKMNAGQIGLSQVPGLLTCLHTSSLDLILRFIGSAPQYDGHGRLIASPASILNTAAGCLLQRLRLRTQPALEQNRAARRMQGVILFGMVSARHGLSVAGVRNLCTALTTVGFSNEFKVVIAGVLTNEDIVRDLRTLSGSLPNLVFHGPLDPRDFLTTLSGCQYALSFDPLGYRNNASAMVNVTRAGFILFSRNQGENDSALIARAVGQMRITYGREGAQVTLLTHQANRYRDTDPDRVGHELDLYLQNLAKDAQ